MTRKQFLTTFEKHLKQSMGVRNRQIWGRSKKKKADIERALADIKERILIGECPLQPYMTHRQQLTDIWHEQSQYYLYHKNYVFYPSSLLPFTVIPSPDRYERNLKLSIQMKSLI